MRLEIISYVVSGYRLERNPNDGIAVSFTGLVLGELGAIISSLASSQIQSSFYSALTLSKRVLVNGHSHLASLYSSSAVLGAVDTNNREGGRIDVCSFTSFDSTQCHCIVVGDDAVEFLARGQNRADLVHSLCTVILTSQVYNGSSLDAVVFQSLQNTCAALDLGYLTQFALKQNIADFGLALALEVLSEVLALEVARGILVGTTEANIFSGQNVY